MRLHVERIPLDQPLQHTRGLIVAPQVLQQHREVESDLTVLGRGSLGALEKLQGLGVPALMLERAAHAMTPRRLLGGAETVGPQDAQELLRLREAALCMHRAGEVQADSPRCGIREQRLAEESLRFAPTTLPVLAYTSADRSRGS